MPKGKAYSADFKIVVLRLCSYFAAEKEKGGPTPQELANVLERVSAATGIGVSTLISLRKHEVIKSPEKNRKREKPVTNINSFTEVAIRNVVYELYRDKIHMTTESLLKVLKARDIFDGCCTSLRLVLRNIGFKWQKHCATPKLYELPNIALARIRFLKTYVQNLKSNTREFVYLDETWIFQKGTQEKCWQDGTSQSVKCDGNSGRRYIIVHAGTKDGFVEDAGLVFASKSNVGDYHGEMNGDNFLKWFENLLLKLKNPSVIVMDNAPYHSVTCEPNPTSNWTKKQLQDWLTKKNISYDEKMLKTELLAVIAMNKPEKKYKVDEMAKERGHEILRLPPYHCIFNPIEHIWGLTKQYYNKNIGRDGYGQDKTLSMWQEALDHITPETWNNTVEHTNKVILDWWDREVSIDTAEVRSFIINLNDDSDSDDLLDENAI